mgnify:CR=1 FL=1
MKKTDKKIDNKLRAVLTQACDIALDNVEGFQWLTHQVDYQRWPQSLTITCVFDRNEQLAAAITAHQDDFLRSLITEKLAAAAVLLNNPRQQIRFDSEEKCAKEHQDQWQQRFR